MQFWLARIVRIVPLYWIFTTLYVAAALITPESFYVVHLEAAHIVKSYLFVPATHPNLGLIAPVYTLGWTLNYEMFFYLLFGFCLFVPSPRLRFALLALAFLLLVAGGLLAQPQGAIARTYTDPIMLEFLAGVMLAILAPLLMRCGTIAGLLLIAGAVMWVAVVYGYGFAPERIVSHGIPAVTAVAGALMIEPRGACAAEPPRANARRCVLLDLPRASVRAARPVDRGQSHRRRGCDPADALHTERVRRRHRRRGDLPFPDRTTIADRGPQVHRPHSTDALIRRVRRGNRGPVRHRGTGVRRQRPEKQGG